MGCQGIDDLPEAGPGHGCAAVAEEQGRARLFLQQRRPAQFQVLLQPLPCDFPEGHDPFLVPLAPDPEVQAGQVAAADRQSDQFRHPHPRRIQQVKHGIIAQDERVLLRRQGQQPVHILDVQSLGQAAAGLRRVDIAGRVRGQYLFPEQIGKKGLEGGQPAGIAAGADLLPVTVAEVAAQVLAGHGGGGKRAFSGQDIPEKSGDRSRRRQRCWRRACAPPPGGGENAPENRLNSADPGDWGGVRRENTKGLPFKRQALFITPGFLCGCTCGVSAMLRRFSGVCEHWVSRSIHAV